MSKGYIGSQQHWEDSVNADYNERERMDIQRDNCVEHQEDNRIQCPVTLLECECNCYNRDLPILTTCVKILK